MDKDQWYVPNTPYVRFKALMVYGLNITPPPELHPGKQCGVLAIDVTQAYLNAPATRTVYVIPPFGGRSQQCVLRKYWKDHVLMQGWDIQLG